MEIYNYLFFILAFVYALLLIIPSFAAWFFISYLQRTNVVPSVFRFASKTDLDIENVIYISINTLGHLYFESMNY